MSGVLKFVGVPAREVPRDSIADIESPALRAFWRYWEEKRGAAPWPPRAAIDPLDLQPMLGHIALLDVIHGETGAPPRFRYRLFGTAFVEWFGFDMTGRTIDEWPQPEYRDLMIASYREVVAAGRPFRRYRSFVKDGRILHYEGLMLPLGDATTIRQVMVGQFFLN
jgi:hypothetical protein